MKNKIFSFIILLVILLFPTVNIAESLAQAAEKHPVRATPTDILRQYSDNDVDKASKNIKKAKEELKKYDESLRIDAVLESIDTGELSYRFIFKNTCIAGDSLMNGLEVYNILNSNNLCTQVSASLHHLSDNIPNIISAKPEILILHYGLNLMDTAEHQPQKFITDYEELIAELKKGLPETRIIISSIFPVDTDKASEQKFTRINEYNQALKKMCKKNSVEFLDNTPIFEKASEYYGGDGIHMKKAFYEKVWLRNIVKEMRVF